MNQGTREGRFGRNIAKRNSKIQAYRALTVNLMTAFVAGERRA
jgi:hypothetical protein